MGVQSRFSHKCSEPHSSLRRSKSFPSLAFKVIARSQAFKAIVQLFKIVRPSLGVQSHISGIQSYPLLVRHLEPQFRLLEPHFLVSRLEPQFRRLESPFSQLFRVIFFHRHSEPQVFKVISQFSVQNHCSQLCIKSHSLVVQNRSSQSWHLEPHFKHSKS